MTDDITYKARVKEYAAKHSIRKAAAYFGINFSLVWKIAAEPFFSVEPIVFLPSTLPSEAAVCKHFGCGRHLSPQEQLFGDRCQGCSKVERVDVTRFINY